MGKPESETTDRKRLDWLELHEHTLGCDVKGNWFVSGMPHPPKFASVREAIDEAMRNGR